ncbi:MAG: 1D-myo-inositol 2-acetamido-2-deoxy-alpha-D-glucopyranoside deacetylase [Luteibacter sp.]|uniref:PIG-L deacetylase family protein n=1 Tax=Luteibacter sp. TaxID=1886636 RepID=UPI001381544D|nr:PIG-L family deacetylase [Luteibacter sp.]KAF1008610.1 MAG: 1D-myo-inositol 2-acetamido-2-deoxy-alpha-D-glucopyranoside deacetylase [Luteibacter sp.]
MTAAPIIDADTRLLVVAPHPDDETLSSGALVRQVLSAEGTVDVLLLTDGDNNPWPQRWAERRLWVRAADRARWGHRRRGEVLAALGRLGVDESRLHALGWPDMGLTGELRFRHGPAVEAIRQVIARVRPNLIALPDIADSHPDHGAAHVLVRLAAWEAGSEARILTYMVHGPALAEDAVTFDTADAEAIRIAAMREHRTQMVLSERRMLALAARPERFGAPPEATGRGSLRLPWHPGVLARSRLRLVLADGQGSVVWPWRKAPLARRDGAWWLALRDVPGPAFVKLTADLSTPWIHDRYGWTCRDDAAAGLVAREPA